MSNAETAGLPESLVEIVEDFNAIEPQDRLQLLLEFSQQLAPLPDRYADHPELLEPVPECQSPIFLITEVEGTDDGSVVRLHFSAPPEAPTTRGFAGILQSGLDGLSVAEVLGVPNDLSSRMALEEAVSPLRLRGMAAMLTRIKRQVAEKARG